MRNDMLHYEFSTYEPDEKNTISLESFLKSLIVCFGNHTERTLRRIKKVLQKMGEDHRVSFEEFIAF